MTLLVAWIGADEKKNGKEIASIYLASDSRYTWGNTRKYDYGIKIMGSTIHPDIFGYCGDVSFPSIVLGQIVPQIDNGILFHNSDDADEKNRKVFSYIESSLSSYPKDLLHSSFTILHATRFGKSFKLFKYSLGVNKELKNEEIFLPNTSTKVFSGGSGSLEFEKNWQNWERKEHNNYRTSRAVYHCLHQTLKTIKDLATGGVPQIMGLYRIKGARLFGIVDKGKKYVYGKESTAEINSTNIEWRNENFERINPETLLRVEGAQIQPS